MRRILASNLKQENHRVLEVSGLADARRVLIEESFDAVITDQKMRDGEGLDVLAIARETDPALSVVFLTAFATVELAVESMRRGAFDFITKPFMPEVLRATAVRAVEHTQLLRENNRLRETVGRLEGSYEIRGNSPGIRQLREQIAKVAPTNASVLITGETGTGKELVARAIHRGSLRTSKPMVPVNCAAFTDTLLENELFGHERGAFTGADRAQEGLFETAHEGTLFLDEAAEMSAAAQAKLLRVLAEGQVMRLGSSRLRHVDVRVIVATHRDLRQRVRDGLFREDLYYRLTVVPLAIPPLRERREDIPELCEHFLLQAARDLKISLPRLSADAVRTLQAYDFPGNIRELRNLIERACILSTGDEIEVENLPVQAPNPAIRQSVTTAVAPLSPESMAKMLPQILDLRIFLSGIEKALVLRALDATGWAKAEAARRLGLSRSDLSYKLVKYRL